MTAHLSRLAKYHIADFVNHQEVVTLPKEWHEMYKIYHSGGIQRHRMPLPEYAMTKEFDLCLRKDVSPAAVEYLFTEGSEATFWYKVPTGLVSTIVELFLQRTTETPLRPVSCVCDFSTPSATLLWQELYVSFFSCGHCERIQVGVDEEVGRRRPWFFHDPTLAEHLRNGIERDEAMERYIKHAWTYVIAVFHIKNPSSGQEMSIELWFDSLCQSFLAPFPTDARVQKHLLRRVKIQLAGCKNPPLSSLRLTPPSRRSNIVSELMLEAYRFLPRYWLDASQLVCDDWRHSIDRAAEHLPLYPLTVDFKHTDVARERERFGNAHYGVLLDRLDHKWKANITNYSDCFTHVNCRDFRFVNAQSPAHSSAVIRRHLRNAFVKHMSCNVMTTELEWSIRMLQGLGSNTVVDELYALMMRGDSFALVERFDDCVRRRKLRKLHLTVLDSLLKTLVVHFNFFGQPFIRQLKELQLDIPYFDAQLEPYWIPALYELRNCGHLKVYYEIERCGQHTVDGSRIIQALGGVLEDFEATGRDIAVDHFALACGFRLPSLESGRKPAHESVRVPKLDFDKDPCVVRYPCDVHYYETADKKKCLTVFVRKYGDLGGDEPTEIHVKRGKISDFGDAAGDDS